MRFSIVLLSFFCFIIGFPAYAATNCEGLKERACVETKGCYLDCTVHEKFRCSPYVCRAAKNSCESSYAQLELTKDKCEAMKGCSYSEPRCFCPGPMECFCGGGPPAQCRGD